MKIAMCITILTGFTMIGMYASNQLNKRIRQLKELYKGLVSVEREIDYELAPLGEAFLHTAKRVEQPWSEFFRKIGEKLESTGLSYDKQMSDTAEEKSLDSIIHKALSEVKFSHPWEKDLRILSSLGKSLGGLDKEMQLSRVKMAEEELFQAIEEAKEEHGSKGKLYQTLGVCMGILGVILLW